MGILSWLKDFLLPPANSFYETRPGWVFDGEEVRQACLMQTKHGRSDTYGAYDQVHVPAAGSDWWVDILDNRTYRDDTIFKSETEALHYALDRTDRRILRLSGSRLAIVEREKEIRESNRESNRESSPP